MFISLRKYLDSQPDQCLNALTRTVALLLETIEKHAVRGNAVDYEKFRGEVAGVREEFARHPAAGEILILAGKTVAALEEYNSRTGRFVQQHCTELQSMVVMLTRAMTTIGSGSAASLARLQDIERQLEGASMLEDIQAAKARMSDCLENLRGEITLQREQSSRAVSELRTAIDQSNERAAARVSVEVRTDPLTGFPERAAAEAALTAAIRERLPVFVVVFIVERLDLINARFGHEVGDQCLLFLREHILKAAVGPDRLFRWTGPALFALLHRKEPLRKVREDLNRALSHRFTRTANVGNREVLLPVAVNWMAIDPAEVQPLSRVFHDVDAFLSDGAGEPKSPAIEGDPPASQRVTRLQAS